MPRGVRDRDEVLRDAVKANRMLVSSAKEGYWHGVFQVGAKWVEVTVTVRPSSMVRGWTSRMRQDTLRCSRSGASRRRPPWHGRPAMVMPWPCGSC